jgi:hypothetical protein
VIADSMTTADALLFGADADREGHDAELHAALGDERRGRRRRAAGAGRWSLADVGTGRPGPLQLVRAATTGTGVQMCTYRPHRLTATPTSPPLRPPGGGGARSLCANRRPRADFCTHCARERGHEERGAGGSNAGMAPRVSGRATRPEAISSRKRTDSGPAARQDSDRSRRETTTRSLNDDASARPRRRRSTATPALDHHAIAQRRPPGANKTVGGVPEVAMAAG